MTQYSTPASDIALNGWTNPSWSNIDELCANYDGVYATSPAKTSATLQCGLSSVIDPNVSSGYGLRVRGYVQSNGVATINIKLYCGATLIKTWTPAWTTSSAEYSTSLTVSEADAITNHADMRVWFEFVYTSGSQGRGYIDTFCFEVPDAPVSGTAAITLAILTTALTGAVSVSGVATKALGSVEINSTGTLLISGLFDKSIENVSLSAAGTVESSFYYEIQRHDGDGIWEAVSNPTSSPFDDGTNLVDGTTYTYRVRLVNGGVPGSWSNETSVTYHGELHGILSGQLNAIALQGTGTSEVKGLANINLASIANVSTAKSDISGTESSNLAAIGLSATAISDIKAAFSANLSSVSLLASGKVDTIGNLSKSLLDVFIDAVAQVEVKATSSLTMAPLSISGELFNIRMENDLSEWSYLSTNGGQISWSSDAALNGSSGGMRISIASITSIYGQYNSDKVQQFLLKFYFDPNSLVMGNGNAFNLVTLRQDTGSYFAFYYLDLYYATATGYRIRHHVLRDDGTDATNKYLNITDAPHCIEVLLTASSSELANDGLSQWWVDSIDQGIVTGIDNYNRMLDQNWQWRFGATANLDAETNGVFYIDEISATDIRAATGKVEVKGLSSLFFDNVNASGTAKTDCSGSLVQSLNDVGLDGSGVVGFIPIEGTASITLDVVSISSSGILSVVGTLSKTLDSISFDLSGSTEIKAVLTKVLDSLSISAAGAALAQASLSATLGQIIGTSSATSSVQGIFNKPLDSIGLAASGIVPINGVSSTTLNVIAVAATGDVSSFGIGSPNLSSITITASGSVQIGGSFSCALSPLISTSVGCVYDIAKISPLDDAYQGGWTASTGTDLYECLNESIPDDLDFMQSEVNPVYSPVVVALGQTPDLGLSIDHTLSYRIGQNGSGLLRLLVELRENYVNESSPGSLIASWTHTLGEMTTYESGLSESEADSIGNYNALFVRMVAEV